MEPALPPAASQNGSLPEELAFGCSACPQGRTTVPTTPRQHDAKGGDGAGNVSPIPRSKPARDDHCRHSRVRLIATASWAAGDLVSEPANAWGTSAANRRPLGEGLKLRTLHEHQSRIKSVA
jgi:hypothetical protein